MSRNLADIPDAHFTPTPASLAIESTVRRFSRHPGICTIRGSIGTGKRTALRLALDGAEQPSVWVSLPPAYGTRDLISDLYTQVVGPSEDFTQRQLQDDLLDALRSHPRAICILNAERLTLEASGQLHWLQDRVGSPWSLYLVGLPDLTSVLNRQPHLREGLDATISIKPIPSEDVPAVLARIHSLFAATDRALLMEIDSRVCKGNLGRWIRFLHTCLDLAQQARIEPVILDVTLARAVLKELPAAASRGRQP